MKINHETIIERYRDHFENYCIRTNRAIYHSPLSYEQAGRQIGQRPVATHTAKLGPRDEFGELY